MQCPKCQFENPSNRKFCRECGAKLVLTYPKCRFENIPSDKFCGDCGHDLTQPFDTPPKDLSFDEKIAKIQKYLPQGLTEKILSQRDRIEGERKQVTVLFTDMAGYTPLTEKLGPEEAYGLMDKIYEILIHKVTGYGGTVNELTGDGVEERHEVSFRRKSCPLCRVLQAKGRPRAGPGKPGEGYRDFKRMWRRRLGDEVREGVGALVRTHNDTGASISVTIMMEQRGS